MNELRGMKQWAGVVGMVAMGLWGCGGGPGVLSAPLSAFKEPSFDLSIPSNPNDTLQLGLFHENRDCIALSDRTKALVNGHELRLLYAGGVAGGVSTPIATRCENPLFGSSENLRQLGLDQETSRIEMTDGTTQLVLEGRFFSAPRELRWEAPTDAQALRAGQQVELEVVGPNDTLDSMKGRFDPSGNTYERTLDGSKVQISGRTLSFAVPSDMPTGPFYMETTLSGRAEVTRCEGLSSCDVLVEYTLAQDGNIQPAASTP